MFVKYLPAIALMFATAVLPTAAQAACQVKIGADLMDADLERGRKAFLKCKACHTVEAGGRNLVGPNLNKLLERPALGASGFKYSPAFQSAAKKWDVATLDAFLEKPSKVIAGNRMVFAGMPKPQERADVIAWLAKESGAPAATCK